MQGLGYLIAAYAIVWLGLCIYLAVVMLRIRGVRTELVAIEELVREHEQENGQIQQKGKHTWQP